MNFKMKMVNSFFEVLFVREMFHLYFVSNPSQKSFQDVPHSPKRKTFENTVGKSKEQKNCFS
jgi:hypothetical protein